MDAELRQAFADQRLAMEAMFAGLTRTMCERFDRVEQRLDKVEQRLDKVEQSLDKVEQRLDKLEARVDALEANVSALRQEFRNAATLIGVIGEHFADVHGQLGAVQKQLAQMDERTYRFFGSLTRSRSDEVERYVSLEARVSALEGLLRKPT